MEKEYQKKIIDLINKNINSPEKEKLISEIRNNNELKTEVALFLKLKKLKKENLRDKLKEISQNMDSIEIPDVLGGISKQAAFASPKIVNSDDLPITDETISDFLSDEEEQE